jgi:glutaredoxin
MSSEKTVEIFSTENCHFCHMAKDWFNDNGVQYVDHNVGVNVEERKRAMEISGQMGVPVILIGDDVVIGFNEAKLRELLGK